MSAASGSGDEAGDRRRLFLTALLVYALFLNPVLTNPMTWSALDAAGALVETGRWEVGRADLYGDVDVALSGSRKVAGPPPGLAVLLIPVYAGWRAVAGPVDTRERYVVFHVVATLTIGATASALAAGEVAALAGWLGAGRTGQLWAALLFAFGTPAFFFGTQLGKENVAALAVIAAFRLSVEPGGPGRRAAAGLVAGVAAVVVYPCALIGLGLTALVALRDRRRSLAAFALGWVAPLAGLALYNTWFFGRPWRFAYSTYLTLPGAVPSVAFTLPPASALLNSLMHHRDGLFLYSPFLLLGVVGLAAAWRVGRRLPVAIVAVFAILVWAVSASWLARFPGWFPGARYLFAAIPLLAAFAGPVLERVDARLRWALAGASLALTYLTVQAGHIGDSATLAYALKTLLSGSGLPVLLKETLPWVLGIETLHTTLARPEVTGRGVIALLATPAGWQLALNQIGIVLVGAVLFGAAAGLVHRLWARQTVAASVAPPVLAG